MSGSHRKGRLDKLAVKHQTRFVLHFATLPILDSPLHIGVLNLQFLRFWYATEGHFPQWPIRDTVIGWATTT